MEAETNERPSGHVTPKEVKSFWFFHLSRPWTSRGQTGRVSESSWYDPEPARPGHHVRRRDKVEIAVALLLLTSLIGLLMLGGACDRPKDPSPAVSTSP
jgi:hypothetical protein